jgi:glucose-6-phosphate isomerase
MSSLTLDFTNCLSEAIGATHGLIKAEVDTLATKFPKHHENVDELRSTGECSFFDLPYQDLGELNVLLKKHQGKWDNLVVVATGGSSIGPRSLLTALGHTAHNYLEPKERKNAPRVFFINNPDPKALTELVDSLDLKKTLFQVTSKSGNSVETLAIWLWLAEQLKKKGGKNALTNQVVFTTDRDKSPLMEIARQEKIDTLPVPTNLPGRFGVLGNTGLFTAGMCGFNVAALLAGAGDMDQRCRHGDAFRNPAYMHALIHYLLTRKRRKTIHVLFSFANRLHGVGEWYSHLCSVSQGKMLNRKGKAVHVGPSPMASLGTFDQHGQMQLYCEGPFDKVVTFITVKDHGAKIIAPATYPKIEALQHLQNADFSTIMEYGFRGTEQHITAAGRPNMNLQLDVIDEANIGGLYYLLQLSTTMSAELYGIDPFDQPGVEHCKHATFAQFGRAGFEDLAKRIKEYCAKPRRSC